MPTALKRLVSLVQERMGALGNLPRPLLHIPLFLLPAIPSDAQSVLTASFDRQQAVIGETVSVRFILEGSSDSEGFLPPDFSGFTVLHGPDTRLEIITHKGRKVPTVTFAYLLRPEQTGILKLGSASVKSDDGTVGSLPIFLRVSQTPASKPANQAFPFSDPQVSAMIRKGLFVRLETDKTEVYVGEPLLVTYKLYTRLNSETEVVRRPTFAGFSVVEVQRSDSSSPVGEVVGGQSFQSYVLRKVHLIPLREGLYELEPIVVHNKVVLEDPAMPAGETSLTKLLSKLYPEAGYDQRLRKTEVTLQSPSRKIRVRPLPSKAPADFTGAVGRFTLTLDLDKDTLGMEETGRLRVVMEGSGNLPLAGHPPIEWPEGLEVFESQLVEDLEPTRTPLSGKRTLVIPFSSARPGLFAIQSASMSAFDPSTGRFYAIRSEPLAVTVKAAVSVKDKSPSSDLVGGDGGPVSLPVLFVGAMAILASLAVLYLKPSKGRRARRGTRGPAEGVAARLPASYEVGPRLVAAERLLSEGRVADGCREIAGALAGLAESRFGVLASAGMDRFREELVLSGLAQTEAEEWADLLKSCEIEAYRPVAEAEVAVSLLNRTRRLMDAV